MRFWLLTNTTYGAWLPGAVRGSVTSVRDRRAGDSTELVRMEHDLPGEPWEDAIPGLECSALRLMKGPPVYLDGTKAEMLLEQFHETATYRGWSLKAVAVLKSHFHLVVEVDGDPSPKKILADFKAYGSRKLNSLYGKPPSETWWTTNGSKRKLGNDAALKNAVNYVLYKQPSPLILWCAERGRII